MTPLIGDAALPAEPALDSSAAIARLFEFASDLLATIDRAGHFTNLNPAWERTLGWSREELLGTRAVDLLHPHDLESTLALNEAHRDVVPDIVEFENRYRCKDGSYRWLQWNARLVKGTWYTVARDVTHSRLLELRAARDPLTGLANRTAATERLDLAIKRLERHPGLVGVLFVDLDHFKVINDARGHEIGDRFLCAAAGRLLDTVRGTDAVARFGGDEFVVLVEDIGEFGDVEEVARRVVYSLKCPIMIDRDELVVGASVGVAVTARAETTPESLLREADIAMYQAKTRGGGCYQLFDAELRDSVEERVTTGRELRVAVDESHLSVYYQPIVALPDATISRCEALVRWTHPGRGLLLPDDFLPSAEDSGLIIQIGERVLEEACRQARVWRRMGRDIGITVNVSTRQLHEPDFAERVRQILQRSELPAAALCLEITETDIMRQAEQVAPRLEALRRLGVQIAMDDFGTGYSSLRYLRSLPLDVIKVDKSFVAGIATDSQDRALVAGLVTLGRETGRDVIAEGVETDAQHAELVAINCELAQGFLYDVPRPAPEVALDGYSSRSRPGLGDPLVIREFMRQIGIPARIRP